MTEQELDELVKRLEAKWIVKNNVQVVTPVADGKPLNPDGPAAAAAIQALREQVKERDKKLACTLGVGDGSGQLFVHGDYESIKAAQAKILELADAQKRIEELKEALAQAYDNIDKAADVIARALNTPKEIPMTDDRPSPKFPDEEMSRAGGDAIKAAHPMRGPYGEAIDAFNAMLNSYYTRTGIDLADVSEKLASGEWVLVPVEPTEAMISQGSSPIGDYNAAVIYRAMIRAAK